jgi:hypothetical protein
MKNTAWVKEKHCHPSNRLNLYQYCGNNPINMVDPWGWHKYIIYFYYNTKKIEPYKNDVRKKIQEDFNSIGGDKNCVTVKFIYRPEHDFYDNDNLGRIGYNKKLDTYFYKFGIEFLDGGLAYGTGKHLGDWAQYEWQSIQNCNNPSEGLRQVYMHELIWHGDSAMNRWGERKIGPAGDLGLTQRNSSDPLTISSDDKEEIKNAFDME